MILQTITVLIPVVLLYMSIFFIIAQILGNNNIVDVAWGLGFILIALLTLVKTGIYLPLQLLVTTLVILWGIRIAGYLFIRNFGKKEDARYLKLSADWGKYKLLYTYIFFFLLQGGLMLLISIPIIFINSRIVGSIGMVAIIGALLWLCGFLYETISDIQIYRFLKKSENRGKIMQSGLWKYSRHPNYFGEILLWWGIWIITLTIPYGWITIIGPATITFIILFVSGIPMAEEQLATIEGFQEYKAKTTILIPWFLKERKGQ